MFTYPFENNIIKIFFPVTVQILNARTTDELDFYFKCVQFYVHKYKECEHYFSRENTAPIADRPTKEQAEIHQSELYIIEALYLFLLYKQRDLKGETAGEESALFKESRRRLTLIETTHLELNHPLAIMLNRYICIAADAMSIGSGLQVTSIKEVCASISSAAKMMDLIYSFEYEPAEVKDLKLEHVPAAVMLDLENGIKIATEDRKETKSDVEFVVAALMKIAVSNLIKVRERLEDHESGKIRLKWLETDADGYVNDKQRICDLKSQIDAVNHLLNLSSFPEYRQLYTTHSQRHRLQLKYNRSDRYYYQDRFPVLSASINTNQLAQDIEVATQLLFKHIEIAESLFHELLILENSGSSIENIKSVIFNLTENINFDTRILIPLAAVCDKRYPDSEYEPGVKLLYLKNALRMSSTILYLLDPMNSREIESTICSSAGVTTALGGFGNSNIASLYALMMQTKYQILLHNAPTRADRAAVLNLLANEIKSLFEQYRRPGEIGDEYNDRKLASQFIIDIYVYALFMCQDQSEINIMIQKDMKVRMGIVLADVEIVNHGANQYLMAILGELKKPAVLQRASRNNDVLALDMAMQVKLNERALVAVQSLYIGAPISDYHAFGNQRCRLSSATDVLFARFTGNIARHLMDKGDAAVKSKAAVVFKAVIEYAQFTNISARNVLARLSYDKTSYRPPALVAKKKKSDFLPAKSRDDKSAGVVAKSAGKANNKKKKKQKKKENPDNVQAAAVTSRSKPDMSWDFDRVKIYYGERTNELVSFYRTALDNRKTNIKLIALVCCARCLAEMKNKDKEQKLVSLLESRAPAILQQVSSLMMSERDGAMIDEFNEIIAKWNATHHPDPVVKPQRDDDTVLPASESKQKKVTVSCFMTLFSSTVTYTPPPAPAKINTYDSYSAMREHCPLNIDFTPSQDDVLTLLENENLEPIIHGGTVFDNFFGVKAGDLDVLCIAKDVASVVGLLKRNQEDLKIDSIKEIKSENVLIIKFDEKAIKHQMKRKSDLQLELYVVTETTDKAVAIIKLARRFGITFIGYDRRRQDIIDPVKLFSKLKLPIPRLDVQSLAVNIDQYLIDYPVRILDMFKRIAKCRNANKVLDMSPILKEHVSMRKTCLASPQVKFAMEKFNRLFMQGYAGIVYDLLVEYDCLNHLFPMLNTIENRSLQYACAEVDEFLKDKNIEMMPDAELEVIRAGFFATAFYNTFARLNDILHYEDDQKRFFIDCNVFISSLPFETAYSNCGELVNKIQDNWWDRICSELARQYSVRMLTMK